MFGPIESMTMSRFVLLDEKYAFDSTHNRVLTGLRGHVRTRWKFYAVALLFVLSLGGLAVRDLIFCCA
jgi:hypothetical protein